MNKNRSAVQYIMNQRCTRCERTERQSFSYFVCAETVIAKNCRACEEVSQTVDRMWRIKCLCVFVLQGTLQQFVDDFFRSVLCSGTTVPPAVKYFFDFLDEQAHKHDNVDEETIHIWKTNRSIQQHSQCHTALNSTQHSQHSCHSLSLFRQNTTLSSCLYFFAASTRLCFNAASHAVLGVCSFLWKLPGLSPG